MTKRKRNSDYEKKIKEGRGIGEGVNYKPWITIQDVPSLGRSDRTKGLKTNRLHGFLSDLERNYFYYLDFSDNVVDIREQFPILPIEETILIAEELGVEHPKNPKTKELEAITTDFLITTKDFQSGTTLIARTLNVESDMCFFYPLNSIQPNCETYRLSSLENEISLGLYIKISDPFSRVIDEEAIPFMERNY